MKIFPEQYKSELDFLETQKGIKLVKDTFEKQLAEKLSLTRVTAPKFLMVGKGLQDDLAGTQTPVSFKTKFSETPVEMVHSLAKWKRYTLSRYDFKHGAGIYTDMDAIRKDEDISEIHSIYVDQWDWEIVIKKEERKIEFLEGIVGRIYDSILETEEIVEKAYPELKRRLPKEIKFITTQELEDKYPELTPKEREDEIIKELGSVFIKEIGYPLRSGKPHDLRAADYDDWALNGDIIVPDYTREKSLEISSMGIRVDKDSLLKQLKYIGEEERKKLEFHKGIIEDSIPLSIGGGIGQSRLCMLLLQKAHIGEVQSSVWPKEVEERFKEKGIYLL